MPPHHGFSCTTAFSPRSSFCTLAGHHHPLTARTCHIAKRCCVAVISLGSPARHVGSLCALGLARLPARSRAAALAAAACLLRVASPRSALSAVAFGAGRVAAVTACLLRGALLMPAQLRTAGLYAARSCRLPWRRVALRAARPTLPPSSLRRTTPTRSSPAPSSHALLTVPSSTARALLAGRHNRLKGRSGVCDRLALVVDSGCTWHIHPT
eukprot:1863096-Pleurochrysis_carterae.AAC.1